MWVYLTTTVPPLHIFLSLLVFPLDIMFYFSISWCFVIFIFCMNCSTFFFFFIERQAAFSTYIGKFLTSSGPQFPMSSFSSNSIYSLLLIPFGGKLTNITFIFLSILYPRVLNLVVLMIRDDRLVNVGKAFRMSSRVLWGG